MSNNNQNIEDIRITQILMTGFTKMLHESYVSSHKKLEQILEHLDTVQKSIGMFHHNYEHDDTETLDEYIELSDELQKTADELKSDYVKARDRVKSSLDSAMDSYDALLKLSYQDNLTEEDYKRVNDIKLSIEENVQDLHSRLDDKSSSADSVRLLLSKVYHLRDFDGINRLISDNIDKKNEFSKIESKIEDLASEVNELLKASIVVESSLHLIKLSKDDN